MAFIAILTGAGTSKHDGKYNQRQDSDRRRMEKHSFGRSLRVFRIISEWVESGGREDGHRGGWVVR